MTAGSETEASRAQRAIWMLERLEPSSTAFRGGYAATAGPDLDAAHLQAAVDAVVQRHETMRATFHERHGQLVQRVHEHMPVRVACHDAVGVDDASLTERLIADLRQPYDLARGPLLRVSVYDRGATRVVLVGSHHITCDLLSARLLVEELDARHAALRDGADHGLVPLRLTYREHAAAQAAMLASPAATAHAAYWASQLRPDVPDLCVPIDHARPPVEQHAGATALFDVPADLAERLEALGATVGATLYPVLLAAYAVLLHRFSGAPAVTIGSYTSGRVRRALDPLVGLLSNAIPLQVELAGEIPFAELVQRVARQVRGAFRHQAYPLDLVAARDGRPRDPSRSPIFQAALMLFAEATLGPRAPEWRHDQWLAVHLRNQEGQFELRMVACRRRDGSLAAGLQYQTALYTPATAARLTRAWLTLLDDVSRRPTGPCGTVTLLDPAGLRQVVHDGNQTARTWPSDIAVSDLVRAQCARTPDATALVHHDTAITYRELEARVAARAATLRAAGAGPGMVVGVCLPPSIDQVVSLLGILTTGAAYLPLDPAHPRERHLLMLADAGVRLTVGITATLSGFPASMAFAVDTAATTPAGGDDWPQTDGAALAYVLYTSGSTGRPKGVEITHGALVNLLFAMQELIGLTPGDTWLSVTTLSFDIAALEIFLPLVCGARLALADREVAGHGVRLAGEIQRHGATVMQATPTSWRLLQAVPGREARPMTRLCGGEALTRALADQLLRDPGPLWNLYGPTETTIWSTAARVAAGPRAPAIGRPLANTQVYVLDAARQPVPAGVVGELWIGGHGLARGYVGSPERTAERFVTVTVAGIDARLYRTGDLARWNDAGELEFVGREDHQVKLRGIRIELGEIEAALLREPEVADAVVVATAAPGSEPQLAAYVVPAGCRPLVPGLLRAHLRARLPDYMVPASFTVLDALPLTANGKIDRRALPAPAPAVVAGAPPVAPRTPVEARLATLMADVLRVAQVGIDDDFFELGGASLACLELSDRALQEGLDVTPDSVFEHRTVRALASRLAATGRGPALADEAHVAPEGP